MSLGADFPHHPFIDKPSGFADTRPESASSGAGMVDRLTGLNPIDRLRNLGHLASDRIFMPAVNLGILALSASLDYAKKHLPIA